MSSKYEVLRRITDLGLVAVVRAETAEQAIQIADALLEGGCSAIEVTFTVPCAHRVIEAIAGNYKPTELILGAGTVLDPETARIAILSGASYIVSPSLNADTLRLCNRYQVPVMPGAMTVREVIEAMEAGADIVKIFPGELFGPAIIKAIRGPLPNAPLMPTGGVDLKNVGDWIAAGAVAVGVGGNLTKGSKTNDFATITRAAGEFIAAIRAARTERD
jgi:2-dehydro-3-deoxyphosphogluconate aldolase/(4S)-4-hydroxy-2-oxoglutarate aldolase